jgi:hypothetical protein
MLIHESLLTVFEILYDGLSLTKKVWQKQLATQNAAYINI